MIKFAGKTWRLGVTRNMPLFHGYFDVLGNATKTRGFKVPPIGMIYLVRDGALSNVFLEEQSLGKYYKVVEEISSSPSSLRELQRFYYSMGERFRKASDVLASNINSDKYFRSFYNLYLSFVPSLFLTTSIGIHISALLQKRLTEIYPKYSKEKIEAIIQVITYPRKNTPFALSQIALLQVAVRMKKSNKIDSRMIGKYLDAYRCVPVGYTGEPWNEKEIVAQIKNLANGDAQKELKALKESHSRLVTKAVKALRLINDRDVAQMTRALQIGTELNEYRKFIFSKASLTYRLLFQNTTVKYSLADWRRLWRLTPEEFYSLRFKDQKKYLNKIGKRRVAMLFYDFSKSKMQIIEDTRTKVFMEEVGGEKQRMAKRGVSSVTGSVGNPGLVRGRARIIMRKEDFKKFKKGDVLIAPMTSVDFVPLMKIAKAFVTNEGGITSHASIISRELNKPCIIGTGIATKIFVDGDFVEVDANKGLVRVVKKNN